MGLKDFIQRIFQQGSDAGKKVEEAAKEGADKAADFTEKVGKDILEKAGPMAEKVQKETEELGKIILEKGKDFSEKAAGFTEDLGRKILDAKEEFLQNRTDASSTEPKNPYENLFKDKPPTRSNSASKEPFEPRKDPFEKYADSHEKKSHMDALKDTPGFGSSSSFFDKAEQFASGQYDAVKGEPTIIPGDEKETEKKDWTAPVYGFEDLDGDGDPVIDDAIIDEEE